MGQLFRDSQKGVRDVRPKLEGEGAQNLWTEPAPDFEFGTNIGAIVSILRDGSDAPGSEPRFPREGWCHRHRPSSRSKLYEAEVGGKLLGTPFSNFGSVFPIPNLHKELLPQTCACARCAARSSRSRASAGRRGGGACPVGSGVGGTKKLPQTCPLPQDLLFCVDSIQRLERGLESIIFVEETSAGTLRGRGRVRGSSGLT